jgi:hypothetical protein
MQYAGSDDIFKVKIKIPMLMFRNYVKLKKVLIPESLNEIGLNAFYNCRSLKRIHLPRSVQSISEFSFDERNCFSTLSSDIIFASGLICKEN